MLIMLPSLLVLAIYILAAVIPAAFLMRYIYRKDKMEPEPPGLLLKLALLGVVAALVSIVLEMLGEGILSSLISTDSPMYTVVLAFLVVAVAEEGAKLFFLYRGSWRSPQFNYRFDGVVYAVFVSLGFAAFENIKYVLGYGLTVAFPRAILAIPGHMGFAVFMGVFYGRAKLCAVRGDMRGKRRNIRLGYLAAILLHGFYDACAMAGTVLSSILFLAFVVVMYIVVIRMVRREAATDRPV